MPSNNSISTDPILEKFKRLIASKLIEDSLEDALPADNQPFSSADFDIQDDGDPPAKPNNKQTEKPKEKKVTINEKQLRALVEFFSRAAREQGQPCCQNSLGALIGDVGIERKTKGDKFEVPANGVFDDSDTIRVSFGVIACPPLAIRIDLQDPSDNASDRILKEDNVTRGNELKASQQFPKDPATSRYSKEIDLKSSTFSTPSTPSSIILQISVKDDCGRIGTFPVPVTFVEID